MTELRRRMIQDMQLRGLAQTTQQSYIRAICNLSRHCGKRPPDRISEEEVHQFLIHLLEERKLARSTVRIHLAACKILYQLTLQRHWRMLDLLRIRCPRKKQPTVLSRREVCALLDCVRDPAARMSLTIMYACGLRASEATHLRADDIDSQRMVLHVRHGKGGKERYVPLPAGALRRLREYWRAHRPAGWLFPHPRKDGPIDRRFVYNCLKAVAPLAKVTKNVTCHTLRHSYATHLLEAGVDIRAIQAFLGHDSLNTTAQYLHLTQSTVRSLRPVLDQLLPDA